MRSFKDYFFQRQLLPTISASISSVSESIVRAVNGANFIDGQLFITLKEQEGSRLKQKEKFSNDVSLLVHSEEFIEELSTKIGEPLLDETEDEFVKRAKASMKSLLSQKLNSE